MSQDSAMVGPTASVLTPCVPSTGAPFYAPRASRLRTLCGLLLSLTVLLPAAASAQGPGGYGPGGPIQQVGFRGHGGPIARHMQPYSMNDCRGGNCPQVTYEYVPPHDGRGQHLTAVGDAARQLWYRLEYLNWDIEDPGNALLGAPRLSGDEAGPFDAVDVVASGFATEPNASVFDLISNNGLRFSLGATTPLGDMEADVWVLNQADDAFTLDPVRLFNLPGDPLDTSVPNFQAATVFTVDGMLSDTAMILYDQGYNASLKTDVFGTEANFVFNPVTPNQPLTIRPMVGFQYINYREHFSIAGTDVVNAQDPNDPNATVTLNHRISSKAQNNVFAPQIGVRAEFVHEWFTVGVTPKFLLGFNRRQDRLRTAQIFDVMDSSFAQENSTEFSPGFDLQVDARVHVNEHFSLFAAYQLYVLSHISRPINNVNYDSIGGTQANLTLNTSDSDQLWFGGLTVGGEVRFH